MRMKALVAVVAAIALSVPFMPTASGATEDQIADALFRKINNKREKIHNLQRTEEWDVIVQEATEHSQYQARQGKISHDGFNPRANRIQKAGTGIGGVCENVAFVSGVTDLKTIVRTFYRGWDKSPPHHDCLFDEDFKTTWAGVGVARVGSSTWYATYIGAQDSSPGQP
jgi:uncharacterized protein YkwD